jgi:hypothetical protein
MPFRCLPGANVECVEERAAIADTVRTLRFGMFGDMTEATDQRRRERIATRIDRGALETIERLAEERGTTIGQVARCILEDGVRSIEHAA